MQQQSQASSQFLPNAPRPSLTGVFVWLGNLIAWLLMALVTLLACVLARTNLGVLLRTLSLASMRQRPLRTSAGACGIALGVASLVAVTIVNHSILAGMQATISELAGKADLQITAASSGFTESTLDDVRQVPGVLSATPLTEQVVSAFGPDGTRERVLVLGIDLIGSEDANFRNYASKDLDAIRRDSLGFLNSTNNILLGRTLAQRLGLRLHDKLRIAVGTGIQDFEIWGLVDVDGVGRAFSGAIALMYYPAMQEAFVRGRNIDRIDVAVAPAAAVESVESILQKRLGTGYAVQQPAKRGDRIAKMMLAVRVGLTMASLSALLAGAFLIFNTSAIAVIQRRSELGVLRALGITRKQLIRLLTLEGALMGVVGSGLGLLLGIAMSGVLLRWTSQIVSELYVQQGVTDLHVDPTALAITFLLAVICSAVAARLATQRASHVQPVEALSGERTRVFSAPQHGLSKMELVGVVLLVATGPLIAVPVVEHIPFGPLTAMVTSMLGVQAFLPRLLLLARRLWAGPASGTLGASTTLAIDGFCRDVGRSAATASGVIAGVALVVCISTFVASFVSSIHRWAERSLPGDLLVTSGAAVGAYSSRNTPLSAALGRELLAMPGVNGTRRIRTIDLTFRQAPVKLMSTDMRTLAQHAPLTILEGDAIDLATKLERGAVAVSENFSRLFDVHRGDQIALSTKNGSRSFEVAAVLLDFSSDLGTIIMDRSAYIGAWDDERVDTYELYLAAGSNTAKVRSAINQELAGRYDLFVLTSAEYRAEIVRATSEVFTLLHVLEIITLLVAALGLMTTVLANVMDRVREIGAFRATGMLRRQVTRMVVIESMLTGCVGAVIGIFVGSATAYIMLKRVMTVQLGWLLPFEVPVAALAGLLLLMPMGAAIAGYLPARAAASLKLRDALAYR